MYSVCVYIYIYPFFITYLKQKKHKLLFGLSIWSICDKILLTGSRKKTKCLPFVVHRDVISDCMKSW